MSTLPLSTIPYRFSRLLSSLLSADFSRDIRISELSIESLRLQSHDEYPLRFGLNTTGSSRLATSTACSSSRDVRSSVESGTQKVDRRRVDSSPNAVWSAVCSTRAILFFNPYQLAPYHALVVSRVVNIHTLQLLAECLAVRSRDVNATLLLSVKCLH